MGDWATMAVPFIEGGAGTGLGEGLGRDCCKGVHVHLWTCQVCSTCDTRSSKEACGKMTIEYSGLERTGLEVCHKVASDLIGFHVIPRIYVTTVILLIVCWVFKTPESNICTDRSRVAGKSIDLVAAYRFSLSLDHSTALPHN